MSYQVIARRWRPKRFNDVVGQRHVTQTLQNALATNRVPHAFLFAGPRGVGKTTTARILAKALNCAHGPTPSPCGECPGCKEIDEGRSIDCLEVDAASNTQVEKTRELLETVQYAPTRGRHKVYIIDEAHMLSTSSFNALLKTLEEPPERVVFILATTEPHKILATIQSRCQRHDFRLLSLAEIVERLTEIAVAEGVTADAAALGVLGRAATGSLRDAESLLDQAIACLGNRLSAEAVAGLLGVVQAEVLAEAVEAILDRDAAAALLLVDRLANHGQDLRQLVLGLIGQLRDLLIVKACPEPGPLLEAARLEPEALRRLAAKASLPELEAMLRQLTQLEAELRRAAHPRLAVEMAILRLTQIRHLESLGTILDQLAALEARLPAEDGSSNPSASGPELPLFSRPTPPPLAVREAAPEPPRSPASAAAPPPAPPAPAADLQTAWQAAAERLRSRKRLASVLQEVRLVGAEGDRVLLEVPNGNAFLRDSLEDVQTRRLLSETLSQTSGRTVRVEYRFIAATHPAPEASATRSGSRSEHPVVREALSVLGGTVVPEGEV